MNFDGRSPHFNPNPLFEDPVTVFLWRDRILTLCRGRLFNNLVTALSILSIGRELFISAEGTNVKKKLSRARRFDNSSSKTSSSSWYLFSLREDRPRIEAFAPINTPCLVFDLVSPGDKFHDPHRDDIDFNCLPSLLHNLHNWRTITISTEKRKTSEEIVVNKRKKGRKRVVVVRGKIEFEFCRVDC